MNLNQNLIVKKVIDWWSDFIEPPADKYFPNGFTKSYVPIKMLPNNNVGSGKSNDQTKIRSFKERLSRYLIEHSEEQVILTTGYGPEGELYEICVKSGLTNIRFPSNIKMRIDFKKGSIEFRQSNGAPTSIPI